ncbi:MAG: porin [Acidiferrobacter sp.]
MKTALLTAALGAALVAAPLTALATLNYGGMAQGELGYWKDTSNGITKSQGTNVLDNGAGRFWISASQNLGDGLKGMAFFMFKVNTVGNGTFDTSAFGTKLNSGEKWVGIGGNFGTVEIGNVASPYKYAGGVTWDRFLYTDLQARGNGGMAIGVFGQNGFMTDSILYTSPHFAGFKLGVAYSPMNAGVNKSAPVTDMTAQHGDYSAALTWKAMGWDVIVARDHAGAINGVQTINPYLQLVGVGDGLTYATFNKTQNNTKAGVKYNFGPVAVMGQFENLDTAGEANPTHDLFVAVDGNVGPWAPALQVGETTDKYYGPDIKANYVAVGTFYNFKKGFSVYGGYRRTQVTGVNATVTAVNPSAANGNQNVFSVGLRKVF